MPFFGILIQMNDSEILLRLRRQFSKDEAVAACNKEISRLGFELGVKRSEVDELTHELQLVKNQLALAKNSLETERKKLKALQESEAAARAIGRSQRDQQENKRLRKELRELAKRFNNLRYFVIGNRLTPPYESYLLENVITENN